MSQFFSILPLLMASSFHQSLASPKKLTKSLRVFSSIFDDFFAIDSSLRSHSYMIQDTLHSYMIEAFELFFTLGVFLLFLYKSTFLIDRGSLTRKKVATPQLSQHTRGVRHVFEPKRPTNLQRFTAKHQ